MALRMGIQQTERQQLIVARTAEVSSGIVYEISRAAWSCSITVFFHGDASIETIAVANVNVADHFGSVRVSGAQTIFVG